MNMPRTNPFHGTGIAVCTPMLADGTIDFAAFDTLIDSLIGASVDFLCILGTTAETPTLSPDEKRAIRQHAVRIGGGRVPLLLGCGSNSTSDVVSFLQNEDLTGFSGVLIVTPYYNKPTQEGLYRHYRSVAEASPLPVVLYNVPGRTGVNLEAATTLRIAMNCPNVVAIKEASGRIDQIDDILRQAPEGFDVISGDDAITFELIEAGAVGVISVVGNAYPHKFARMVSDALHGQTKEALALHREFGELYKLSFKEGNPAGIKAVMAAQGKIQNVLRLPLVPVSQQTEETIKNYTATFADE